jgi:hypothetical protein
MSENADSREPRYTVLRFLADAAEAEGELEVSVVVSGGVVRCSAHRSSLSGPPEPEKD